LIEEIDGERRGSMGNRPKRSIEEDMGARSTDGENQLGRMREQHQSIQRGHGRRID